MRLTILGATGTIGRNSLAVVAQHPEKFSIIGLTAHQDVTGLANLATIYKPTMLALGDERAEVKRAWQTITADNKILARIPIGFGAAAVAEVAGAAVDRLVVGIVGVAALKPLWCALHAVANQQNKMFKIALANKEAVVAAGHLLLTPRHRDKLIPIDSEHNAIFQCLLGQDRGAVEAVILTASGGPFLRRDKKTFHAITPAEAIAHPRWRMGKKISVDSATLFNKGLEVIEAAYLFSLPPEQIKVVIHPQSFVHSVVVFCDGSHLAQMGAADMKIPISFVLHYPARLRVSNVASDLATIGLLQFEKPDEEKFAALGLARRALRMGGAAPLVLNSSNEALVAGFLAGVAPFTAIEKGVAFMLDNCKFNLAKTIDEVITQDEETKIKTNEWLARAHR